MGRKRENKMLTIQKCNLNMGLKPNSDSRTFRFVNLNPEELHTIRQIADCIFNAIGNVSFNVGYWKYS